MTKSGKNRVVKRFGVGTTTKADDARAVKVRGKKGAALTYDKGGRTISVSRNVETPSKVRVNVTGPGGRTRTGKLLVLSLLGLVLLVWSWRKVTNRGTD